MSDSGRHRKKEVEREGGRQRDGQQGGNKKKTTRRATIKDFREVRNHGDAHKGPVETQDQLSGRAYQFHHELEQQAE